MIKFVSAPRSSVRSRSPQSRLTSATSAGGGFAALLVKILRKRDSPREWRYQAREKGIMATRPRRRQAVSPIPWLGFATMIGMMEISWSN